MARPGPLEPVIQVRVLAPQLISSVHGANIRSLMGRRAPFNESAAREAIASSICWADALRKLGYEAKGSNFRTLKKYARLWGIATRHFDQHAGRRRASARRVVPLDEVLVANSRYPRGRLKDRLYAAGIKQRNCEMCGQGEMWQGREMSLILDHVNGVANDHRLENLRIVCPNCAATLDTHCARGPKGRAPAVLAVTGRDRRARLSRHWSQVRRL